MSWSIGWDSHWNRDIGYGVPAYCDHPQCNEEIDRGLAFVCGGEPYGGGIGCGLYFCEKHHSFHPSLCERCENKQEPFSPKPDHPEWTHHKMTDESWAEWRKEKGIATLEKEAWKEKAIQLEKENVDLKHKLEIARIVIGTALDEANIYFSKDLLMNLERAQAALTPKEKETK